MPVSRDGISQQIQAERRLKQRAINESRRASSSVQRHTRELSQARPQLSAAASAVLICARSVARLDSVARARGREGGGRGHCGSVLVVSKLALARRTQVHDEVAGCHLGVKPSELAPIEALLIRKFRQKVPPPVCQPRSDAAPIVIVGDVPHAGLH